MGLIMGTRHSRLKFKKTMKQPMPNVAFLGFSSRIRHRIISPRVAVPSPKIRRSPNPSSLSAETADSKALFFFHAR